ncbi:DUF1700 domain-containing protein [Streptococcus sciuri]|uniref:DUF1700 domain-containing protein n=1 Tax=Streptococcus sciuri TaxID=2973939 RepID=A0ABT2F6S2_9STRE|nr:DUF1700 domain-containing protein [Streptococcus sciuri]MCS4488191.1 DUF1700 domain-containing protein [Streptococcus sciuri]
MKRAEYLTELDHYLCRLQEADHKEAMEYFTEYFDEAGRDKEEEVIRELGTPREAASEIIHNILGETLSKDTPRSYKQKLWIAVLAILIAPIGLPLAITLFAILAVAFLFLFAIILAGFGLLLASFSIGVFYVFDTIQLWQQVSLSAASLSLGIGMIAIGGSLLACLIFYQFIKWFGHGLLLLIHTLTKKGEKA